MEYIKNNINDLIIDVIQPAQLKDIEELQAIYDARQSFYKKAYTGYFYFNNGEQKALYLLSYNTIVACIFQNQLRIYGAFSPTTARHIREFAKQNEFNDFYITYEKMKNTCVISK